MCVCWLLSRGWSREIQDVPVSISLCFCAGCALLWAGFVLGFSCSLSTLCVSVQAVFVLGFSPLPERQDGAAGAVRAQPCLGSRECCPAALLGCSPSSPVALGVLSPVPNGPARLCCSSCSLFAVLMPGNTSVQPESFSRQENSSQCLCFYPTPPGAVAVLL